MVSGADMRISLVAYPREEVQFRLENYHAKQEPGKLRTLRQWTWTWPVDHGDDDDLATINPTIIAWPEGLYGESVPK
ncbi:hypothetical protein TruAng_011176 [Truncatella angustata]|nr:hypothetical protein TruAng_011176 [Truncatella angustata]